MNISDPTHSSPCRQQLFTENGQKSRRTRYRPEKQQTRTFRALSRVSLTRPEQRAARRAHLAQPFAHAPARISQAIWARRTERGNSRTGIYIICPSTYRKRGFGGHRAKRRRDLRNRLYTSACEALLLTRGRETCLGWSAWGRGDFLGLRP